MKVHHLNCSTMCPVGGKILPNSLSKTAICHCLLVETSDGLVLIDTGLALSTLRRPSEMGLINHILNLQPREEDAAVNQVQKLGYSLSDVRHIIPTHLDIDHASGIVDFPSAIVHTSREEYGIAVRPRRIAERFRYNFFKPGTTRWQLQDLTAAEHSGEDWFGFKGVRPLAGSGDDILMIPLFGHTRGHFGVAVRGTSSRGGESGWMLHAGDAYYSQNELADNVSWDLKLFMSFAHGDHKLASYNRQRLRTLRNDHPEVRMFCAHDPTEFHE